MSEEAKRPLCLRCEHFKITYEPAYPNSCLVFGIKSREMPSAVVLRNTGQACPAYKERLRRQ